MKTNVLYEAPTQPVERVLLDLSVAEFAVLESLRYNYLSSESRLRSGLDSGFSAVRDSLATESNRLVNDAHGCKSDSYAIQRLFA